MRSILFGAAMLMAASASACPQPSLIDYAETLLGPPDYSSITGFNASTTEHCSGTVIVSIYGTTLYDPRDLIGIIARQMGARSNQAVDYTRRVIEDHPDQRIVVVGHSAGGSIASYVGAVLNLETVSFNSIPTPAAMTNDGHQQTVVVVRDDLHRDEHDVLNGRLIWLDHEADLNLFQMHRMSTVLELLQ